MASGELPTTADDPNAKRDRRVCGPNTKLLTAVVLLALTTASFQFLDDDDATPDPESATPSVGAAPLVLTPASAGGEPARLSSASAPPPPAVAAAAVTTAAAASRPPPRVLPPFSAQEHCKRSYDRAERGSAFSRCGGADAHSCCRASQGVSCYYLVPMAMCEAAEAAQVAELAAAGGAAQHLAALAAAAPVATAAVGGAAAAHAIVPMIMLPPSARRLPRLVPYPEFNLSWTRGAPPPRADGWLAPEAQRRYVPERDLKESYHRTCAIVGSSGNLRRSRCATRRAIRRAIFAAQFSRVRPPSSRRYGWFIDQHEMVMRFNGAPAGGGYAADVGSKTTLSLLADTVSSECLKGTAKQTVLDAAAAEPALVPATKQLAEPAPGARSVHGCDFYGRESASSPPELFFLPQHGTAQKVLAYAAEHHPAEKVHVRSDALADEVDGQIDAYRTDASHPTSGFNGVNLALHICETIDVYGFGTHRDKYFSPPKKERPGSQHLYRSEYRWLLGLELRFPNRVKVWS